MARRRRKKNVSQINLFQLFVVVGVLWLVAHLLQDVRARSAAIHVITAAGVLIGVFFLLRSLRRFVARQEVFYRTRAAVRNQLPALTRRRAQLVYTDAYGKSRLDGWRREIRDFISHQVTPSLTASQRKILARNYQAIETSIENRVGAEARHQQTFESISEDSTPSEFEAFCAEELRRAGWDARVTRQSRDQGVDVVAEKNRVRVVVQCKWYSRPVGNKSVQEVVAAKAHEQAHHAAVVTNTNYTSAAEQLASTNKVVLLHYRDLPYLEDILNGSR